MRIGVNHKRYYFCPRAKYRTNQGKTPYTYPLCYIAPYAIFCQEERWQKTL